jgi:AcrR family transcriptional regulator
MPGLPNVLSRATARNTGQRKPNAVREQLGDTVPSLLHRLPRPDEARETLLNSAQQAIERAREAVNSAVEALPDVSERLPIRQKRRPNRRPWIVAGVVLLILGGAFFAYRKLTAPPEEDWMSESWPEQQQPATQSADGAKADANGAAPQPASGEATAEQTAPPGSLSS